MAEEKKQSVTVYSYRKVWFVEKKIYAFQNIVLPFPIAPLRHAAVCYGKISHESKTGWKKSGEIFLRLSAVPVYQKGMHRAVPNLQRPWSDSKNQLELRQKAGIMEEKDVSVSHFVFYKKYNF